jgi:hypothetical protein
MTISHTLIGLGGVYGLCVVNNSAKKSLICDESSIPVPETDTGGEVENTKGREITLSKELGKIAP